MAHGIIHCPVAPSMEISFSAEAFSIHLKYNFPFLRSLENFLVLNLAFSIEFATSQLSLCDDLRD